MSTRPERGAGPDGASFWPAFCGTHAGVVHALGSQEVVGAWVSGSASGVRIGPRLRVLRQVLDGVLGPGGALAARAHGPA